MLLIDDTTIRTWHALFETDGVDGLAGFNYGGRASPLTMEQQEKLKGWVGDTLPRTTRMVGAGIEHEFEVVYESRSGLIALLHRLEHRKPEAVARPGQTAGLHRRLRDAAEDAARRRCGDVRRRGASHPLGGWLLGAQGGQGRGGPGRERLNIHGALDLETAA